MKLRLKPELMGSEIEHDTNLLDDLTFGETYYAFFSNNSTGGSFFLVFDDSKEWNVYHRKDLFEPSKNYEPWKPPVRI